MAETIEHLIERIQKEGIEKADATASEIVSKAREQAAALVKDAESRASAILLKADKDSEAFALRNKKTLEQAARDVVITVGQGIEKIFQHLADGAASQALNGKGVDDILIKIVQAYIDRGMDEGRLEVLVGPQDRERIEALLKSKFQNALKDGIAVRPDGDVVSGFKVGLPGKSVTHDFTKEAIAESICRLIRPQLAEIVRSALAAR